MNPHLKKYFLLTVKLLVMGVLVTLVVRQVHWQDYRVITAAGDEEIRLGLFSCLKNISLPHVLVAQMFMLTAIVCSSLRWRLLLMIQDIGFSRANVLKLSFLGEFFNNFFPGSMGGDAVRAYYVMKHTGKKSATLVSIFADRFSGLSVLTIMTLIILAAVFFKGGNHAVSLKTPAYSIIFIALAIFGVLFFSLNKSCHQSRLLEKLVSKLPFSRQIQTVREAVHQYRKIGRLLPAVFFFSLMSVLSSILTIVTIGAGLGIDIAWQNYFLYLPLIFILSAVPVTPGGLGVTEELFLYFFSAADDPNNILAMVLFFRFITLVCAIPGAIIFLFTDRVSRKELAQGLDESMEP